MKYAEGICPECKTRVSAVIHMGDDNDFRSAVGEMTISGLTVNGVEQEDVESIDIARCPEGCQAAAGRQAANIARNPFWMDRLPGTRG